MTSPTNLSARLGMILLISVMMIAPIQSYCKLRCKSEFVEDCEICHTVHVRDCTIQMKSVLVPVKIRKCSPPSKLTTFDGIKCVNGSRTRCKVRWEITHDITTTTHPPLWLWCSLGPEYVRFTNKIKDFTYFWQSSLNLYVICRTK